MRQVGWFNISTIPLKYTNYFSNTVVIFWIKIFFLIGNQGIFSLSPFFFKFKIWLKMGERWCFNFNLLSSMLWNWNKKFKKIQFMLRKQSFFILYQVSILFDWKEKKNTCQIKSVCTFLVFSDSDRSSFIKEFTHIFYEWTSVRIFRTAGKPSKFLNMKKLELNASIDYTTNTLTCKVSEYSFTKIQIFQHELTKFSIKFAKQYFYSYHLILF